MGPEYTELQLAGQARGAAHGLPGGRLPQHLRMLGGPRGDLPHRRRPVHPAVRLLPDRHRQAGRPRPRRAAPGRRVRPARWACATPPITGVARDDLPDGGAWLYAETVAPDPRSSTPAPASRLLIPDFNGKPDLLRRGVRLPAGGARPQRRDRAADLQAHPPRLPLRAVARRASRRPGRRPGHQVQPHPRHGRDPRRDHRRRCATCTTPAATC